MIFFLSLLCLVLPTFCAEDVPLETIDLDESVDYEDFEDDNEASDIDDIDDIDTNKRTLQGTKANGASCSQKSECRTNMCYRNKCTWNCGTSGGCGGSNKCSSYSGRCRCGNSWVHNKCSGTPPPRPRPSPRPSPRPTPSPSPPSSNEYNLIRSSCKLGSSLCKGINVYPNDVERTELVFINTARMHPTRFRLDGMGKHKFGKYGPQVNYYTGDPKCGKAKSKPFYMSLDGVIAARWGQWDCQNCNGRCGHATCSTRCNLFGGDCGAGARVNKFLKDGTSFGAEGLCGANMCYTDGHCGALFADRTYIGLGLYPGTNGFGYAYLNGGPAISYPIPSGSHFQQDMKLNRNFHVSGKGLTFMANWYHSSQSVSKAFVAYKGKLNQMNRRIGSTRNGVWQFNAAIPSQCEPYYFVFKTTNGQLYRLPQNQNYFFGTSTTMVGDWWNPSPSCGEYHYWKSNGVVKMNSGPDGNNHRGNCVGCSKVNSLPSLNSARSAATAQETAQETVFPTNTVATNTVSGAQTIYVKSNSDSGLIAVAALTLGAISFVMVLVLLVVSAVKR